MKPRVIVRMVVGLAALASALAGFGCGAHRKMSYRPEDLRDTIAARTGQERIEGLVVPFEVDPDHIARARLRTAGNRARSQQARIVKEMMFDPAEFGLRYAPVATATARETLRNGVGNCLSLASVYIGLARGVGLVANYLDASARIQQVRHEEEVVVKSGHVTAVVETEIGRSALDFGERLSHFGFFRTMDDIEAIAHFYNNRGYELIYEASSKGEPVPWSEVARHFRIATRVTPGFIRAWNNLGVAHARMGHTKEAIACYHKAIELDPDFPSPHTNLGILFLGIDDLPAALASFRIAAELDPDSPHVHYHLGLALYRSGRIEEAAGVLERTLEMKRDYQRVEGLLEKIRGERSDEKR